MKILKNKNKSNEINIKSNTPREINKKNNNNAIKEDAQRWFVEKLGGSLI